MDILAGAMRDLVGLLNSPRRDDILLREAGVALDRALFPLLVRIAAVRELAVGELAEQVGRDHSTISRQCARLAQLGLITRQPGMPDRRVSTASVTVAGKTLVRALTAARRRLLRRMLAEWEPQDRRQLALLSRRFADALAEATSTLA